MEMKSAYNYGTQKSYDVTLYGDKCGNNIKQLLAIYNEYYTVWITDVWRQQIGKHKVMMSWQGLSELKLQDLAYKLAEIGAFPEICIHYVYLAFRDEVLQQDPIRNRIDARVPENQHERIRKDIAQFRKHWYSGALTAAHEYSFELWAKSNAVDEAYRFTMIPAFHNVSVIRVWRKENSIQLVDKIGGTTYFCDYKLQKTENKMLEQEDWNTLKSFMDQNFWTANSWFSGRLVGDGTIYLFEGWKDGQYKVLDEDTPFDEDAPAVRAMREFSSLVN